MKEMRVAVSPEKEEAAQPHEMHIIKRRGKFHGHVVMSNGQEHHAAPAETMHEVHAQLLPHMGEQAAEMQGQQEGEEA